MTHEEFSSATFDVPPLVFSHLSPSSVRSRIRSSVFTTMALYSRILVLMLHVYPFLSDFVKPSNADFYISVTVTVSHNYTVRVTKSIHQFHLSASYHYLFIFSFVPSSNTYD